MSHRNPHLYGSNPFADEILAGIAAAGIEGAGVWETGGGCQAIGLQLTDDPDGPIVMLAQDGGLPTADGYGGQVAYLPTYDDSGTPTLDHWHRHVTVDLFVAAFADAVALHPGHLIGEDRFEAHYKPIPDPSSGDQVRETVTAADKPEHVWTIVEGDEGLYAVAGLAVVNRLGYVVTEVPWPHDQAQAVWHLFDGEEDES